MTITKNKRRQNKITNIKKKRAPNWCPIFIYINKTIGIEIIVPITTPIKSATKSLMEHTPPNILSYNSFPPPTAIDASADTHNGKTKERTITITAHIAICCILSFFKNSLFSLFIINNMPNKWS